MATSVVRRAYEFNVPSTNTNTKGSMTSLSPSMLDRTPSSDVDRMTVLAAPATKSCCSSRVTWSAGARPAPWWWTDSSDAEAVSSTADTCRTAAARRRPSADRRRDDVDDDDDDNDDDLTSGRLVLQRNFPSTWASATCTHAHTHTHTHQRDETR